MGNCSDIDIQTVLPRLLFAVCCQSNSVNAEQRRLVHQLQLKAVVSLFNAIQIGKDLFKSKSRG